MGGTAAAARAVGLALALGAIAACSTPAPADPVRLAIAEIGYDCLSRVLTVAGHTDPAMTRLDVQVQVRTAPERRGVVWARVETDGEGRWRAVGRDLAVAAAVTQGPITLVVQAGAVVDGVRVFSTRQKYPLACQRRL